MKGFLISAILLFALLTNYSYAQDEEASEEITYEVETKKSIEDASEDLIAAAKKHGFGTLATHNMKETLKEKGFDLDNEAIVFEVCNPKMAHKVLTEDILLNMALPCRISIYTDNGKTYIGMLRPSVLLLMLTDSDELASSADSVERTLIKIINEAK